MFNAKTLEKLIEIYRGDQEELDFIFECLDSFERYHRAVFDDQFVRIVYSGADERSDYAERRVEADMKRTRCHNAVIMNVGILNRMAAEKGLDPVYDGVVSEDRPFRREVADAVFGYLDSVFAHRN